jgi:hypothetical protein
MKTAFLTLILSTLPLVESAGQDTYHFLRNDIPPRTAALGGSFASMEGDPNSLFVNPAALTTVEGRKLAVSYMDHLLDIHAGTITFTLPESPMGFLAVGVMYYHYGSFDQTDPSAHSFGTFSASDLAVSVGTAYTIAENLSVGGSLKFIHSSISEYQSEAAAADIGGLYRIPGERISIGISLLHAGAQLSSYAGSNESLPTDLKIGITKRPEHLPVFLNLNFHGLNDSAVPFSDRLKQFSFGAEFEMSTTLQLRMGFNNRVRRDLRLGTGAGLAGFSFGAGIEVSSIHFDYAFNSYGSIGGLHRLGLSAIL